jgi:opacity protein-like surface antigen
LDYNLYGDPSISLFRVKPPRPGGAVSGHVGYALPMAAYSDYFDPGFTVLVDVGYRFNRRLAVAGLVGYNAFSATTTGLDDTYWININPNLRFYQPITGPLYAYAGAGPGYYIPKAGDSKFGFNVGGGLDYALNQYITLEAGADYHRIFDGLEVYDPTYTDDAQFLHIHVGAIVSF